MPDENGVILDWYDWINLLCPITGYREKRGVIQVKRTPIAKHNQPINPPDRTGEKITKLSKKSMARLATITLTSDVEFQSMLTLTYPDIPTDGALVKKHLNYFLTWLRREVGKLDYVWFLEFQKRGAPHLHFFLSIPVDESNRKLIAWWWATLVTKDKETQIKCAKVHAHEKAWEQIRAPDACARYALKYALKTTQKEVPKDYVNVGRFWGCSRATKASWDKFEAIDEATLRALVEERRPGFNEYMYCFTPSTIFALDINKDK